MKKRRQTKRSPQNSQQLSNSQVVRGDLTVSPSSSVPTKSLPRDEYLAERSSLIKAAEEAGEEYSKQILTISCGAFGISLILIDKLVHQGCSLPVWFVLIASWIALGSSIFFTMMAYIRSFDATDEQLSTLDSQQLGKETDLTKTRETVMSYTKKSAYFMMLGIFLLGLFAALNPPLKDGRIVNSPHTSSHSTKGEIVTDKDIHFDKVEGRYVRPNGPVVPDIKVQPEPAPPQNPKTTSEKK